MINYSDENIFNKTVFKCLTFDPFTEQTDLKLPPFNLMNYKEQKQVSKLNPDILYLYQQLL
jgi:hypothetical protein